MSNISNVCSNAGKAVEKLSRLEIVGMQEGNARKRKQECEAECKQKRADTRFSSRTDREGVHCIHQNSKGNKWIRIVFDGEEGEDRRHHRHGSRKTLSSILLSAMRPSAISNKKFKMPVESGREYLSFLGSKKACIYISMRSGVKTYGCMYSNGCSDARKGCEPGSCGTRGKRAEGENARKLCKQRRAEYGIFQAEAG